MSTHIRPLLVADLPALEQIDANYIAESELLVEREQHGLSVTFNIREQRRPYAYVKRAGYSLSPTYQSELSERMARGQGLYLAAEREGRLVGLLDAEPEEWRPTAALQWIVVDRAYRGQGIGRLLIEQALHWARAQGHYALVLETQNTNIDACRFYLRAGFSLCGVQNPYYFDERVAEECALFWVYQFK